MRGFINFPDRGSVDDVRPPDIGVQINGVDVDWEISALHIYTISFLGTGSAITMSFLDITGGYSDNSGNLAVPFSRCPPSRIGTADAWRVGCL